MAGFRMKTPEQIADAQIEINANGIRHGEPAVLCRAQIIAAIEADRAQRRELADDLRETFEADLRENGTIRVLALAEAPKPYTQITEQDRLGMAFRMGIEAVL